MLTGELQVSVEGNAQYCQNDPQELVQTDWIMEEYNSPYQSDAEF